ncbi:MAG: MgtC/SapB family protein [Phycisphaerales bacterium]|nr:MgtC/SapB family protein [Planctomycetota bacterium]MCH8509322.1 MgtC/SapB family protein [Phycisphaerales bacterium]
MWTPAAHFTVLTVADLPGLPPPPVLWEIGLRLVVAGVLGILIGWERGRADKPADSRTMMLISVGAAAFALTGVRVIEDYASGGATIADPTRVLSYIISGVGFLGAGAILHSKKSVRGLTTASSVWCTAAVGAACGMGQYFVAAVVTIIVMVALWTPWFYYELTGRAGPGGSSDDDDSRGIFAEHREQ